MSMRFADLLNTGIELDLEVIANDMEGSATFCWGEDMCITRHAMKQWPHILEAEVTNLDDVEEGFASCVYLRIHNVDDDVVEAQLDSFLMAAAGYIAQSEYDKCFTFIDSGEDESV